jgi:hypothetical protein
LKPSGATGRVKGSSGPKKKLSTLLPTLATPTAGWTAIVTTRASRSVVVVGRAVVDVDDAADVVGASLVVDGSVVDSWPLDDGDRPSSLQAVRNPPPTMTAAVVRARNSRRV